MNTPHTNTNLQASSRSFTHDQKYFLGNCVRNTLYEFYIRYHSSRIATGKTFSKFQKILLVLVSGNVEKEWLLKEYNWNLWRARQLAWSLIDNTVTSFPKSNVLMYYTFFLLVEPATWVYNRFIVSYKSSNYITLIYLKCNHLTKELTWSTLTIINCFVMPVTRLSSNKLFFQNSF